MTHLVTVIFVKQTKEVVSSSNFLLFSVMFNTGELNRLSL